MTTDSLLTGQIPPPAAKSAGHLSARAPRYVAKLLIEPVCVLLLISLFGIVLAGAVSRYAFHAPLVWVDELAGFLFLWFAILGASIASQRYEHMRMPFSAEFFSPRTTRLLDTLGGVLVVVLLGILLPAAVSYTESEWVVITPTLGLPNGIKGVGLVVGLALLLFFDLCRLWSQSSARDLIISTIIVAIFSFVAWKMATLFGDLGKVNLVIYLVFGIALCIAIGVPIGFAFGIGATSYVVFATRFSSEVIVGRMDEGMSHVMLVAIPLFVALGAVMELSGVARAMVRFLFSIFGSVKGGLNYVIIGAMMLVSGISGSKIADMAAVAPPLFPEMNKRGSSKPELVALLASTGVQTETIPPSFVLIIYGSLTGVSIGALFTGGLLPALFAGLVLAAVCAYKARKTTATGEAISWVEIVSSLKFALPALLLPFMVRTLVVEGVATATEVATFAIVYCALVGICFYRAHDWSQLYGRLVQATSLSGAIILILGTATGVSWALSQSGFSRELVQLVVDLPGGRTAFMGVSIILFVILGSVLEGMPAVVLFAPLLAPIAQKFGINDVHYAVVVILSLGLGLFAPPIGVGFYAACAIGDVNPKHVVKLMWPYLLALLMVIVVLAAFPWLTTAMLPESMRTV
ncbi:MULTISPECIES: TRAP transporter large permease subunit [unclassified Variovorax]|uniref:TRAP transporter large permease n=1 Tax=unclassified Variovorax TaxID=663243 RepID=UPI00083966BB|nr:MULTISPECIES: TRAP transporter large permease subunit [unclassified Variovorax]PNG48768.1 Sialic acid TRAP transporter permease protein SiaT [Variovorax sp. B2]PNG49273.1 Sialic acid TRAP transporter permease protein SiaT [Variovorax sp. B4]VTV18457.1 Neu5Ac permease [Variovorax sp. WDL1]